MTMSYLRSLLTAGILSTASFMASGQNIDQHDVNFTIDEVATLQIVDASAASLSSVSFHLTAPGTAGAAVANVSSQSIYLQYTSVKGATPDDVRKVTIDLASGTFPDGITLNVDGITNGYGNIGTGQSLVLSNSVLSGDVITGIGSCYTGTSPGEGCEITYSLNFSTQNLDASSSGTVTLRYTISNV